MYLYGLEVPTPSPRENSILALYLKHVGPPEREEGGRILPSELVSEVRMVSLANRNKVETTAEKQGANPNQDHATAALPERLSLGRLVGRERAAEPAESAAQSVTKTLGLGEKATNQEVINALFKRYERDYSAMYKGAQRDFGIDVEALVKAKQERFISKEPAQGRDDTRPSGTNPDTTRETPLQNFLKTHNLDGTSTNRELINALYARYGVNDATTYARARKELAIDIDKLASNRDGRIDGKAVVSAPTEERLAPTQRPSSRVPRHDRQTTEKKNDESPSPTKADRSPSQTPVSPETAAKREITPGAPLGPSAVPVSDLVRNYPKSPLDAEHAHGGYNGPYLRDQFSLPQWIDNSCAIRLSYALHKCGIKVDTKGTLTETVRPTTDKGDPEAPFVAMLRAKELFAKLDSHFGGAEKQSLSFSPDNKPNLSGLSGFVLYEVYNPTTRTQTRHIGIIDDGKEQTLYDPIAGNERGKATLLVMDRQDTMVAMR